MIDAKQTIVLGVLYKCRELDLDDKGLYDYAEGALSYEDFLKAVDGFRRDGKVKKSSNRNRITITGIHTYESILVSEGRPVPKSILRNPDDEQSKTTEINLSPTLFWTLIIVVMGALFYAGFWFGQKRSGSHSDSYNESQPVKKDSIR